MNIRRGETAYDAEVTELYRKLHAKGVILIVVKGDRNKNDVETSIAVDSEWHRFTALSMIEVGKQIIRDGPGPFMTGSFVVRDGTK